MTKPWESDESWGWQLSPSVRRAAVQGRRQTGCRRVQDQRRRGRWSLRRGVL